jgi:hypothetical protein
MNFSLTPATRARQADGDGARAGQELGERSMNTTVSSKMTTH